MSAVFWFVVGGGIGSCLTGLALNGRYGRTLDMLRAQFDTLIAEHDHITTGLIERIKTLEGETSGDAADEYDDGGEWPRDPIS